MEAETCQLTTGPVSVNVNHHNGIALHSTLGSRKGCERATRWVKMQDTGQRVASTSNVQDPTTERIFIYALRMFCSDLDPQGFGLPGGPTVSLFWNYQTVSPRTRVNEGEREGPEH